jgi:hypothetical protein
LTNEGITCASPAKTGLDNCEIDEEIECGASALNRLGLVGGAFCVPKFTWKEKTE